MRDEAIAAGAQKVALGGSAATIYGGFTANEIAAFGGLLIAAIGLIVQWYYKRKDDKRRDALHAAQLERLREGDEDDGP
jgi:hypothetical protein